MTAVAAFASSRAATASRARSSEAMLDAGRIRATGRHEELLATDPLYRELASSQFIGS